MNLYPGGGYRFYIRHYDFPQNWETVIYAIPPKKEKAVEFRKKKKRVVTIAPFEGWGNAQLLKDCGVIPYLLFKNHGCNASMVGGKVDDEYSNLHYVKGMNLEFLPNNDKISYLKKKSREIDCLLLYGPYHTYFQLVDIYKQNNPRGKVSLALDANSGWMDRIQWAEPGFLHFMEQCNVITVSGRTMQKHLNEKWPWAIEYIPNGFYNFSSKPWNIDFNKKENIILTVSRLGTPQKATNVLLEAFAKIAEKVPGWELHLAGGIEESFHSWLDEFWVRFPKLKGRIRFLGSLDRDEIYAAYAGAKIFALTSTFEGFPNVIPEALNAGNAIAITKIDEYRDAIDNGRCGMASDIGDIDGFADILLCLCQNEKLDEICRRAYAYGQSVYNMEKIVARLYTLIFGEEAEG